MRVRMIIEIMDYIGTCTGIYDYASYYNMILAVVVTMYCSAVEVGKAGGCPSLKLF